MEFGYGVERFFGKDGEYFYCVYLAKKVDGGGLVDCDIIGGFDFGWELVCDGGVVEVKYEYVV